MQGIITVEAVHQFVSRHSLLQDVLPGEVVEFTMVQDCVGSAEAINIRYCGIPVAARIPLGRGGIVLLKGEQ
jgi:hypothetical protein